MAKKRKKKGTAKQRKAWAAAGRRLKAWSRKHGGSKKKRRGKKHGGSKKRRASRKHGHGRVSVKGMTMSQKLKSRALVKRLMDRGYTQAEAESRIRRLTVQSSKKVKAAAEAAAAKAARHSVLANAFAGFGMAGRAAAVIPNQ